MDLLLVSIVVCLVSIWDFNCASRMESMEGELEEMETWMESRKFGAWQDYEKGSW